MIAERRDTEMCLMDVTDWFTDNALYCLPDGTIVRAVLDERDDAFRWIISDLQGQRLFMFRDDGRVHAYVWERMPHTSLRLVPCDLVIEDLHAYVPASDSRH